MLNKNYRDKIVGGIQTVERLHVRVLLDLGYDVIFMASSDTERFNDHPNLTYRLSTHPSEESAGDLTRAQKSALSKAKTAEFRSLFHEEGPDVILCHSYSSSHVKLMTEFGDKIPTMIFVHQTPAVAMDISMIAKVQAYLKLTNQGGKLMMTSPYQRDMWRDILKRRVRSGSEHFSFLTEQDVDRVYDWIIPSAYMREGLEIQPSQDEKAGDLGHFIVVSRPDPAKGVHRLLELVRRLDDPSILNRLEVFLAWPGKLEDNEYYRKKLSVHLTYMGKICGLDVKINHNAPRAYTVERVSKAMAMFLPGPNESSPMTLLESVESGVWPITFAKKRDSGLIQNAAATMLAPSDLDVVDAWGDEESAVKHLEQCIVKVQSLTFQDRIDLRDRVLKSHSYEQRVTDMRELIAKLSLNYKAKPKSLIEF